MLRNHNFIMTKLESRPIHGNPWEERCFISIFGEPESQVMQSALREPSRNHALNSALAAIPAKNVVPVEPA
ncbi:hypothetical protein KCP73_19320 [Salmonella enterica subsp. enterica]|nr:hypothetical protein KCP73_19320 [Salmonella enterica subsp. enterica]